VLTIKNKLTKHDQFVESLFHRLEDDYDVILKGVPIYSKKKRLVGEIDMIGIKNNFWDLFEVKCSHRITKAKMQLKKCKKLLHNKNIRRTYFFCGDSGLLMKI